MAQFPQKPLLLSHASFILDCIACGVFTVDEDMKITYFNRTAEKITGVSQDDAIGRYCFEVLKANICEKTCVLRRSLETGTDFSHNEVNILRTDGKRIPVSICTAVLKNETGKKIGGVETFQDVSKFEEFKKEIRRSYTHEDIISKNHKIQEIFNILPNIAESDASVLIQGPSGSGKELFARAIHNLSLRKKGPFIAINCGALPETLLESELFGYVKGAFTDAKKDKPGRFALAKGGTIFLDEVESLLPSTQVKLLRVLQEREFEPLGATKPVKANVRVISAAKDNLCSNVAQGTFRDDLYFRLNVVKLTLPPLKGRREDIPLLIDHFVDKFNRKLDRYIERVSDDVQSALMYYDFPGNVRELENIIEHAFVMCRGNEIQIQHLPPEFSQNNFNSYFDPGESTFLQNAEQKALLQALEKNNWNKIETAKELGVHRGTLWRKMKKYGLI